MKTTWPEFFVAPVLKFLYSCPARRKCLGIRSLSENLCKLPAGEAGLHTPTATAAAWARHALPGRQPPAFIPPAETPLQSAERTGRSTPCGEPDTRTLLLEEAIQTPYP